jgi:hypothetical protein
VDTLTPLREFKASLREELNQRKKSSQPEVKWGDSDEKLLLHESGFKTDKYEAAWVE